MVVAGDGRPDAARHRGPGRPGGGRGSAAARGRHRPAPARSLTAAPVAINARAAVRREIGGVERWARELSEQLPRAAARPLRRDRARRARSPTGPARPGSSSRSRVAARRAELLLSPANLAPLAGRRNVVVIHDSAPFREPAWYGRAYGVWHRALVPRVARRARLVIVPSEHVRGELAELFGLAGRARACGRRRAWTPPSPPRRPGAAPAPPRPRPALRARRRHRQPAQEPGAARRDRRRRSRRTASTWPSPDPTRAYMPGSAAGGARRLGYVPDADLPALYAGAAAFAMPSLYEGFGLPCVEAMAAGTPVVAADRAALPEACGGAALLADPRDADAFAAALLEPPGRSASASWPAGRERAAGSAGERTRRGGRRARSSRCWLLADAREPSSGSPGSGGALRW